MRATETLLWQLMTPTFFWKSMRINPHCFWKRIRALRTIAAIREVEVNLCPSRSGSKARVGAICIDSVESDQWPRQGWKLVSLHTLFRCGRERFFTKKSDLILREGIFWTQYTKMMLDTNISTLEMLFNTRYDSRMGMPKTPYPIHEATTTNNKSLLLTMN